MANKYPYVASAGPLLRTIEHLRRSFPREVTADTLRKLGLAPKNESYVINVLRFLGVIDDQGKKADPNAVAFLQHETDAFAKEFKTLVRDSYEELFELHGDDAWDLDRAALTQFFRTSDHSTDVVGKRQAGTFVTLARLSGYGEVPKSKEVAPPKSIGRKASPKKAKERMEKGNSGLVRTGDAESARQIGLTVRIEVNLPVDGDQETYDRIFRSIRENLIDEK